MAARSERLKAREILDTVRDEAQEELQRTNASLAFSGLAAGLTLGFSAMGVAFVATVAGSAAPAPVLALLYPIGFVAVVIGRAQLFTENSLYPVVVVLEDRARFRAMIRLWAIVLAANVAGALLFALLVTKTPAFVPDLQRPIVRAGEATLALGWTQILWRAIVAGWIIAFAAWLVTAADSSIARVALLWVTIYLIAAGGFVHSIAGSTETLATVLTHEAGWLDYLRWLGLAVTGNVAGGVLIVTLVNYGQVHA